MKPANIFLHCFVIVTILSQANSLFAGKNQNQPISGDIPTRWSESENITWKTEIHDKGWSTPLIIGDQIWVTSATEDGKKMYAICVSGKSGEILHDILVLENEKPSWKNSNNTYDTPSPVAKDGFVYVEFGSYGTACIEAKSGAIVWKRTDVSTEYVIHGPASSPIIYKNLLILHHEATRILRITALDIKTGATVWQVHRPEECYAGVQDDWRKSHASPIIITVNGKDQLISSGSQVCQSFDPETGKELWRILYGGHDSTVSSPVFWNGVVYINTGLNSDGVEMWAVRPDGSGDVTNTHVLKKIKGDVPGLSTPVVKDGLLFMVSEKGQLSCLDANTGGLLFKQKVTGNYNFNSSPSWIGNMVFLTSHDGITTVIKADKTYQLLAENKLDGKYVARPTVFENSLILRSDSHIYRIETNAK
jgi:outer membrane protein assembly factor BamB